MPRQVPIYDGLTDSDRYCEAAVDYSVVRRRLWAIIPENGFRTLKHATPPPAIDQPTTTDQPTTELATTPQPTRRDPEGEEDDDQSFSKSPEEDLDISPPDEEEEPQPILIDDPTPNLIEWSGTSWEDQSHQLADNVLAVTGAVTGTIRVVGMKIDDLVTAEWTLEGIQYYWAVLRKFFAPPRGVQFLEHHNPEWCREYFLAEMEELLPIVIHGYMKCEPELLISSTTEKFFNKLIPMLEGKREDSTAYLLDLSSIDLNRITHNVITSDDTQELPEEEVRLTVSFSTQEVRRERKFQMDPTQPPEYTTVTEFHQYVCEVVYDLEVMDFMVDELHVLPRNPFF